MTSGKERQNKNILRCRRNECSDWADVTSLGRLFRESSVADRWQSDMRSRSRSQMYKRVNDKTAGDISTVRRRSSLVSFCFSVDFETQSCSWSGSSNWTLRFVSDIDECEERPCVNANCYNTEGSFRCECFIPGTSLDHTGRVCVGTLITATYVNRL